MDHTDDFFNFYFTVWHELATDHWSVLYLCVSLYSLIDKQLLLAHNQSAFMKHIAQAKASALVWVGYDIILFNHPPTWTSMKDTE